MHGRGSRRFAPRIAADQLLADVPEPVLDTLLGWMDRDEKITALKTIQGMIWEEGYRAGDPQIRHLSGRAAGAEALVAGRLAAVRLLLRFGSGAKTAVRSQRRRRPDAAFLRLFRHHRRRRSASRRAMRRSAAARICRPARRCSSPMSRPSWTPARAAGLRTCQLVRPQDGTKPCPDHDTAADFAEVARKIRIAACLISLPSPGTCTPKLHPPQPVRRTPPCGASPISRRGPSCAGLSLGPGLGLGAAPRPSAAGVAVQRAGLSAPDRRGREQKAAGLDRLAVRLRPQSRRAVLDHRTDPHRGRDLLVAGAVRRPPARRRRGVLLPDPGFCRLGRASPACRACWFFPAPG